MSAHNIYRLASENIAHYYKSAAFVFTQADKHMYITIQLPLTNFRTSFTIWEIHTFDLPMHDGGDRMMRLKDAPHAIAVEAAHEYYFKLTPLELADYEQYRSSKPRRICHKTNDQTCMN